MFTKILTSSLLFLVAIGGFFMSVRLDESVENKNIISSVSIEVSQTYAATGTTESDAAQKWLNEAVQGVNAALGIITVIVSPAIIFAGWLMSPDWTSGDLFGLRTPMHDMWVIVSNIVYFIYAVLLIIIALATILGKESFNYKVMLPRLALGILMVPFTWWFVQWTISLASVVTASVINIPMDMVSKDGYNKYVDSKNIPKEYFITTDASGDMLSITRIGSGPCDDTRCTSAKEMLSRGGGTYSTLMIYAYQIFKIQDYKKIDTTKDKLKTAGQLLNNIFISAIMLLVFGLLVMALIAMLLLRAIKLWMYAIFSPIFTLHFVAGKELFGNNTESFDIKDFIGLCFVPAVVGLTLSFGLMIVSVIQAPNENVQPRCTNLTMTISDAGVVSGGCPLLTMFGNPENEIRRGIVLEGLNRDEKWMYNVVSLAGVKIYFKGKATVSDEQAALNTANSITGGLDAAGGIFGTIIVDIIALIFIWMSFMAAKGVSKAVSAAIEPFEKFGKSVGDMAMKVPQYTPLPGLGMSMNSLGKAPGMIESGFAQRSEKDFKENNKFGKLLNDWAGGTKAGDTAKTQQAIQGGNIKDIQSEMAKYDAHQVLTSDVIAKVTADKEALKRVVGKLTMDQKSILDPIIKKIEEGKEPLTEVEKLKLAAILGGSTGQDVKTDNLETLKKIVNERQKSGATSTSGTNGGSQPSSVSYNKAGNMEVNIYSTNIEAKGVSSASSAEQIANAIKDTSAKDNYKNFVTKAVFIETMTAGLGGTEAAKTKATGIAEKLGDNFFKTEPKADTKPAEPTEPKK